MNTQTVASARTPMPEAMKIGPKASGKGAKPALDVANVAASLVSAYYDTNATITRAKNAQLPALALALKGVEPIIGTAYAKDWDAPMRKALADRGLEGRSLITAASRMKVCTIALTHVAKRPDIGPEADANGDCTENLQAYVDRVRPVIRDEMGVYEGGKPRATGAAATGSAGRAESGSKPGKAATLSKEGAALLVAGTPERANILLQVMSDDGLRSQFDKWAKYQLEEA